MVDTKITQNQTNLNILPGLFWSKSLTFKEWRRKPQSSSQTSLLTKLPLPGLLVGFYKLVDDKHPRLAVSLDPGPDTAHCELLHSFSRRKSLRDRPLSRRTSPATRSSPAPQCVSLHDQFWSRNTLLELIWSIGLGLIFQDRLIMKAT